MATWSGEIIEDASQDVRVAFLRTPGCDSDLLIELVEPLSAKSPVQNYLKRGVTLYHLCYEVQSLQSELEASRAMDALVVRAALPAPAFNGRLIAWIYTRERLLVEYLQK